MYAGAIVEELGELVGVQGGRHQDEFKVWPRRQNVLANCHQEIRMNISLVNLRNGELMVNEYL